MTTVLVVAVLAGYVFALRLSEPRPKGLSRLVSFDSARVAKALRGRR